MCNPGEAFVGAALVVAAQRTIPTGGRGWNGPVGLEWEEVEGGMELGSPSVYEAVTRRMVETVAEELKEIKNRLNGLLFMVAGAILVDLVLRLAG